MTVSFHGSWTRWNPYSCAWMLQRSPHGDANKKKRSTSPGCCAKVSTTDHYHHGAMLPAKKRKGKKKTRFCLCLSMLFLRSTQISWSVHSAPHFNTLTWVLLAQCMGIYMEPIDLTCNQQACEYTEGIWKGTGEKSNKEGKDYEPLRRWVPHHRPLAWNMPCFILHDLFFFFFFFSRIPVKFFFN